MNQPRQYTEVEAPISPKEPQVSLASLIDDLRSQGVSTICCMAVRDFLKPFEQEVLHGEDEVTVSVRGSGTHSLVVVSWEHHFSARIDCEGYVEITTQAVLPTSTPDNV